MNQLLCHAKAGAMQANYQFKNSSTRFLQTPLFLRKDLVLISFSGSSTKDSTSRLVKVIGDEETITALGVMVTTGLEVGNGVITVIGSAEKNGVGASVGCTVGGAGVKTPVGMFVGVSVGGIGGLLGNGVLGGLVGRLVGTFVGTSVGEGVVGTAVGGTVGRSVGLEVAG
jgi:hypothetical protein